MGGKGVRGGIAGVRAVFCHPLVQYITTELVGGLDFDLLMHGGQWNDGGCTYTVVANGAEWVGLGWVASRVAVR